jgi:hypothetical protein
MPVKQSRKEMGFTITLVETNNIVSSKREPVKRKLLFVVTIIPPSHFKKKTVKFTETCPIEANIIFNKKLTFYEKD